VEQHFFENIRSDIKRLEVATLRKTPTTVAWRHLRRFVAMLLSRNKGQ